MGPTQTATIATGDFGRRAEAALEIRPFAAADLTALDALDRVLSPRSRYLRFFTAASALPTWAKNRLATLDGHDHDAVAGWLGERLVGWAEYGVWPDQPDTVDLGVLVGDPWQRRGFGPRLVAALLPVAEQRGFREATATILSGNFAAVAVLRRVRPDAAPRLVDGLLEFRFPLQI